MGNGVSRGRIILRGVLTAGAASLLPGCYAAAAGIVAAIAGSSSGGGGTEPVARDVILVGSPQRIDGGHVGIKCTLTGGDTDRIDVSVLWRPANGSGAFRRATLVTGQLEDVGGLPWIGEAPEGRAPGAASFTWKARDDIEAVTGSFVERVMVELRISKQDAPSRVLSSDVSDDFWAGNVPPVIHSLDWGGETTGAVPLIVELHETSPDDVEVQGEFRVGGGEYRKMTLAGPATFRVPEDRRSEATIVWSSRADFDRRASREVHVRVIANDIYEREKKAVFELESPIPIDNNSNPSVTIDVAPGDTSFGVPIRYSVLDAEEDTVMLLFQWALEEETFPPLDIPEIPTEGERSALAGRLLGGDPASAEWRRERHILTPARIELRGVLDRSSNDLDAGSIREIDLVRLGLSHVPPGPGGPRESPGPHPPGEDPRCFLVGKPIAIEDPAAGTVWNRIIRRFDPRGAIAVLDAPLPRPLPAGALYRLSLGVPPAAMASAPDGAFHTFVWDSLADLRHVLRGRQAEVKIQAWALDLERSERPSNAISFRISNELLVPAASLPTGEGPVAVASGDLNGDGLFDVVAASARSTAASVYLQDASGHLAPAAPLEIGGLQTAVAVHDVSCDGLEDILFAHAGESGELVSIFLQTDGPEAIPALRSYGLEGAGDPVAVASGYSARGEGGREAFVALAQGGSPALDLFYSGSDCSLPSRTEEGVLLEEDPLALALGKEGDVLVVATAISLRVHTRNAGERFGLAAQDTLSVSGAPSAITLGDFDGDGREDILAAIPGFDHVSFYPGLSTAKGFVPIQSERVLEPGDAPSALAALDLDGDGLHDTLLVANVESNTLAVHLQTAEAPEGGGPRLSTVPDFELSTGVEPVSIATGDLNGDGLADAVVANAGSDTLGVYLQSRPGSLAFERSLGIPARPRPIAAAAADLNGDGRRELVIASAGGNTVRVHRQSSAGEPSPETASETATLGEPRSLIVGDWSSDGLLDLALPSREGVELILQDGKGGLLPSERRIRPAGDTATAAAGDFNGDGAEDLIVAVVAAPASFLALHLQVDSKVSVEPVSAVPAGSYPAALAVGDLDADGLDDAVVADPVDSSVVVHRRLTAAGGPLAEPLSLEVERGSFPLALAAGDLTGDGRCDVVVATARPDEVRIYSQLPGGTLDVLPLHALPVGDEPVHLAIGDLTGDGLNDLVVVSADVDRVQVFHQVEGGRLTRVPALSLSSGRFPAWVAIGDLNGDCRNDLTIVSSSLQETAEVYLAR